MRFAFLIILLITILFEEYFEMFRRAECKKVSAIVVWWGQISNLRLKICKIFDNRAIFTERIIIIIIIIIILGRLLHSPLLLSSSSSSSS